MKNRIFPLATALAVIAVVVVSAAPPPTGPAIDQGAVDAAMERLRAKQGAGRSLEERVGDLERKVGDLESQNKRIVQLESRLDATTKQIDQLVHSPAAASATGAPDGRIPKEKMGQGRLRTWQCWVKANTSREYENTHPYRDYVQAVSSNEALEMFMKKHPREDISQVEEKR